MIADLTWLFNSAGLSSLYIFHSVRCKTISAPDIVLVISLSNLRFGKRLRAFSIAFGSCTTTSAPAALICSAISKAGESLTSSLSGLNAAPSTAIFLDVKSLLKSRRTNSITRALARKLMASI